MSFTIDQRDQDQIVGLQYEETEDGRRWYGLRIWDRPSIPIADMVDDFTRVRAMPDGPDKTAAWKALSEKYPSPERLFAGKLPDGSVVVGLRDSRGKMRIRLSIGSDDRPQIELMDEKGNTVWSASGPAAECSTGTP